MGGRGSSFYAVRDKNAKKELNSVMSRSKDYYDGFKVRVSKGYVSVEKNGIKSKKSFIYNEKDKDWNSGALSNLVQRWKWENE